MASKYHNLSNAALADEIGRVDAIARAGEAELKALKDEFKARGLDYAEGELSTVTASEVFKNTIDVARVREALGDRVKQFETLIVSTVIRIKPTRRLQSNPRPPKRPFLVDVHAMVAATNGRTARA
jgi:hypothetical protein